MKSALRFLVCVLTVSPSVVQALPLQFIENDGQWDARIRFCARGPGLTCTIEPGVIAFDSLRLEFIDVSSDAVLVGEGRLPGSASWFKGKDWRRWRSDIASYRSVLCEGIHPCIDLRVRVADSLDGKEKRRLEYDLLLGPGADPGQVAVRCRGADSIEIDENGCLVICAATGLLRQAPPRTWQELPNGRRAPVECSYRLVDACTFGFEVTALVPDAPLVIDPVLAYIGGSGDDDGFGVALDASGNVYVCGDSPSSDLPFPAGIEPTQPGGGYDAFVMKINQECTAILWTAVLGGSGTDRAFDVRVSSEGKVMMVGSTDSGESFPVTAGAWQESPAGALEGFAAVLDPNPALSPESQLLYSTLLGGTARDVATAVAPGPEGSVYAAGYTESADFPATAGAFDTTYSAGTDIFLVRLAPDKTLDPSDQLLYSTFIGGQGDDGWPWSNIYYQALAPEMLVGGDGVVTLVGCTRSADFPTTVDTLAPRPLGGWDGYVLRLRPDRALPLAQQLVTSTFVGGSGDDFALGLSLEPPGFISITGETGSQNFPVTDNAFQKMIAGSADAFAARLPLALDAVQYATFLGGGGFDGADGGTADRDGRFYLCGATFSTNFPVTPGALKSGLSGERDGFFSILEPSRAPNEQLVYSTYLGGGIWDESWDVVLPGNGYAFVTGYTNGSGFETGGTSGTFDDTFGGISDAFLARFPVVIPEARFTVSPSAGEVPLAVAVDAGASTTPPGTTIESFLWDFGDGAAAEGQTAGHTFDSPGRYMITLTVVNNLGACHLARETVLVQCATGNVEPWTAVNIGEPSFPGGASRDSDCFSLCAGGKSLMGRDDKLLFVERELTDNFTLTLRILEMEGPQVAQFGLMARISLEAGSAMGAVAVYHSSLGTRFRFTCRSHVDGSVTTAGSATTITLPALVRLGREGNDLIGSCSPDGQAWTELGRGTLEGASPTLFVGLFGAGTEPSDTHAAFVPLVGRGCLEQPASPVFRRGDANADTTINIADAIFVLGHLFAQGPAPSCKDTGDANDDGTLDIADAVKILGHLFAHAGPLSEPFEVCGADPSDDGLPCDSFAPCEQ